MDGPLLVSATATKYLLTIQQYVYCVSKMVAILLCPWPSPSCCSKITVVFLVFLYVITCLKCLGISVVERDYVFIDHFECKNRAAVLPDCCSEEIADDFSS